MPVAAPGVDLSGSAIQLRDGRIANASFTDCLPPTILAMPPVVCGVVEVAEPGAPYGAKGVGEGSTIVATAATADVLQDATGRGLNRVPVRPDDLIGLAPPRSTHGRPPIPDAPGPRPTLAFAATGDE